LPPEKLSWAFEDHFVRLVEFAVAAARWAVVAVVTVDRRAGVPRLAAPPRTVEADNGSAISSCRTWDRNFIAAGDVNVDVSALATDASGESVPAGVAGTGVAGVWAAGTGVAGE
jgi:hypothetical protein